MKERPILFSGSMVRAILEGRKTQTRRIVKPQPEQHAPSDSRDDGWRWPSTKCRSMLDVGEMPSLCPYGVRGERLWVREAVRWEGGPYAVFDADDELCVIDTWPWIRPRLPGMFLPRGGSRITLEITEVRVQRLQEISEDDAQAEGVEPLVTLGKVYPSKHAADVEHRSHRAAFERLWDSINGKRATWASNPWVWCVSFRRLP